MGWRLLKSPYIQLYIKSPARCVTGYKEWSLASPQRASLGLPAEGKRRWCSGCAKGHVEAVYVSKKKCEDCQLKLPSFGLPGDGKKRRWCFGCAKGHAGAVDVANKKCEGCGLKQPSFRLLGDGKTFRWCSGCAKGHAGAVDVGLGRIVALYNRSSTSPYFLTCSVPFFLKRQCG